MESDKKEIDTFLIEKDVAILNILNIINPSLGKAYEEQTFNPFEDGFVMQENFVKDVLQTQKEALQYEVLTEDFLEHGNQEAKKHFEYALNNTNELLLEVENNQNKSLDKAKFFLKNRQELLKQAIEKINNHNYDGYLLYEEIVKLDPKLSEALKQTFYENFDKQIVVQNFLKIVNAKTKNQKLAEQKSVELLNENVLKALKENQKMQQAEKNKINSKPKIKQKTEIKEKGQEM